MESMVNKIIGLVLLCFFLPSQVLGEVVEYDLSIERVRVNIHGIVSYGMMINEEIPGPVLHFTEGDIARIKVRNLMDVPTSIHWHGLLVPPGMDGVPLISFPPIEPGAVFTYKFPIRQAGTYWYHSHSGLQEQRGVYGSIVIQPAGKKPTMREEVVLFSDWTSEDPNEVHRTLKRGSEWYAVEKGSAQSIFGAAKTGNLGGYFKRELIRMPPMDIADVAYDYFLANGIPEISLDAKPGAKVKLRLVNGSATTYFNLQYSGGLMTIVAADGLDVEPVELDRFLMAVAETYDVIVDVPQSGSFELRATAHDGSGYSSVWLGEGTKNFADTPPMPDLYHSMGELSFETIFALTPPGSMGMGDRKVESGQFDKPGSHMSMHGMDDMGGMMHGGMDHGEMAGTKGEMEHMDHSSMSGEMGKSEGDNGGHMMMDGSMHMEEMEHHGPGHMCPACADRRGKKFSDSFGFLSNDISSRGSLAMDGMAPSRPWPPYAKLRSKTPTAFPKDKPVREIRLTLDGDMERYVWMMNNRTLSESDVIKINEGEVVRFILINRTMMHHPMHLHGHFFRVVNAQGDYSPLKHTVDAAPMSTTVIEFYSDEVGDWFFHCHLLYHMKAGMARMIHYEGFDPGSEVNAIRPGLFKDSWNGWGQIELLTNMTEGFIRGANSRNILTGEWEAGWGQVDETEWEITLTWQRYVNRFFTLLAGGNFEGADTESEEEVAIVGFTYLLPMSIDATLWGDSEGQMQLMLEKELELTPRVRVEIEGEYHSEEKWEGAIGIEYLISKPLSLEAKYHSEFGLGGGMTWRF